jgi:glycosyltransferase involved in cell wall biosynthesis
MGLEGRRVLFISYNGMLEPLGQTQVIPYLSELAKRGVVYSLLSFEQPYAYLPEGVARTAALKKDLQTKGIEWHWLPYHRSPSIPATIYDVMAGTRYAKTLARRNGIEMVHARGHIAATIALALKKSLNTRMIFDLRGLMAEEYVDAGHWTEGNLAYRITKAAERRILSGTDAIVTLTERIWPIIREWEGLKNRQVHHAVIPCCVDLERFRFSDADRQAKRAELNLEDRFTIIYSGSIDGWYLTEEMADFFAAVLRLRPEAHLLWLTGGRHERISELMAARNIGNANFSVRSVAAAAVPSYLAAGDAGLAFIKRCFSKLASSPTKNGEYLACGLPLVINAGVGDSDALVDDWRAGVLVNDFDTSELQAAGSRLIEMASDAGVRARMRSVAEQLFDLSSVGGERYSNLYESVLSNTSS